jgi:hypothetical protein
VELVEHSIGFGDELAEIVRRKRDLALRSQRYDKNESAPKLNLRRLLRKIASVHCPLPAHKSTRRVSERETASLIQSGLNALIDMVSTRLPPGAPGASGKSSRIANARHLGPTRSGNLTLAGC